MPLPGDEREPIRLGACMREAWRRQSAARPCSVYLLLAVTIAVLLGVQIVHVHDNPRKFAFLLALYFVFFLVVILRAILDSIDILRAHARDSARLYRLTLGEAGFVHTLHDRLAAERGHSLHDEAG